MADDEPTWWSDALLVWLIVLLAISLGLVVLTCATGGAS